ncbi:Hsp70 family protein [Amycolatopsis magusensis]|uniref:Hsp70 family protein n=1 Tax=Amycolatopsis magusensis TaxID=882444 RepID=UPI003C2F7B0A
MPYVLGIDLGHTRTTAAVCRRVGASWGEPQVVALDGDARWVESVLHVAPDGSVVFGQEAARRAIAEPQSAARGFLGRSGDSVPLVLGHHLYTAEVLTASLAGWVADQVAESFGGPADRIVVTHPAGWGPHRRSALRAGLEAAGLPGVLLLPKPVAAAENHLATEEGEELEPGSVLAVCRIGGEHVESALVRRTQTGFDLLAHTDSGVGRGSARIDDLLAEHVLARSGAKLPDHAEPALRAPMAGFRVASVLAKERLSVAPSASLTVPLPEVTGEVHVTRAELEQLAKPVLAAAVGQLQRLVEPVPDGELAAALLVGGGARIPLVTFLAESALGCPVLVDPDPAAAVCRGAALVARPRLAGEGRKPSPRPRQAVVEESTALIPRALEPAAGEEDAELGPPPPRPPVEVTPLEAPKRFTNPLRRRSDREPEREDSR